MFNMNVIDQYIELDVVVLTCILTGLPEEEICRNTVCVPLLVFGASAAIG